MIQNKGITCLEIMVTLCLLSILLVLACGSVSEILQKESAGVFTDRLYHALNYARLEAIKRNQFVNVCGSSDFMVCDQNWDKGVMIYVDVDQSGDYNAHDIRLKTIQQSAKQLIINPGQINSFRYMPNGGSLTRGSIHISTPNSRAFSIVLYDSGRARVERYI